MDDISIAEVRAFNRFYTRQIGLLDEHIAQSAFSLAEARVLYEISERGHTTGTDIARALGIDKAYLSRMLQKFAAAEMLLLSPIPGDRRQNQLALSADGDAVVDGLNRNSDAAVRELLQPLAPSDLAALRSAMRTIRTLLGDELPQTPVILRPYRIGELGWLVHRQGLLYNQQFGWNGEFEALIAGIYSAYVAAPDTPAKNLWVAERNGAIAGSIFVMPSDGLPGSAQLRMLYVEPSARGLGIGTTLVDQCVSFARAAGYERMRLWTHTIQTSARRLYANAGFEIAETKPHHQFGKDLISEIWEKRF